MNRTLKELKAQSYFRKKTVDFRETPWYNNPVDMQKHPTTHIRNPFVSPVLKWVGGKRQLLNELSSRMPTRIGNYIEPFVGGGALLFDKQPKSFILNDTNEELINVYVQIRDSIDELVAILKHFENNEREFYRIRAQDRDSSFDDLPLVYRAARILYLNKTCYNGLFRVNSAGEFNSPFGFYKNPNIVNEPVLRAVHDYFCESNASFMSGDFTQVLDFVKRGDFVYLDPPYVPVSDSASFTGYTQRGFGEDDQRRLFDFCRRLDKKKVKFMLSNSSVPFIHGLYRDFTIEVVYAKRNVNSIADKRGEVPEVIIRNYENRKKA